MSGVLKFDEAEAAFRECLEIGNGIDVNHWSTHKARGLLGEALIGLGRLNDAKPLLIESLKGLRERKNPIPKAWQEEVLRDAEDRIKALEVRNGLIGRRP